MKDFLFDVEPLETAPQDAFYHHPDKLMIRVLNLTDDMKNVHLYCETISMLPAVPPYQSRLNVSQDNLIMPYATLEPAIITTESGETTVDETILNGILQGFFLKLKPPAPPEETSTEETTSESVTDPANGI